MNDYNTSEENGSGESNDEDILVAGDGGEILTDGGVAKQPTLDAELKVRDLRVIRPQIEIEDDEDVTVRVTVDGEEIASQGAAGVYGLLWIPADTSIS